MESIFSEANVAALTVESTIYISFPLKEFRNPEERKKLYTKICFLVWLPKFPSQKRKKIEKLYELAGKIKQNQTKTKQKEQNKTKETPSSQGFLNQRINSS